MGADYLSARAPWPTFADGRAVERDEDLAPLDARIDALSQDALEEIAEITSGCTLADYAHYHTDLHDAGNASQAELERAAMKALREYLKSDLRELLGTRRDTNHDFDGIRWWISTGGMSWGDSPTEAYDAVRRLDVSGVTVDPLDGGEFADATAVAAAVAVVDDLAAKALAALDRCGLPADARQAAADALAAARDEVVPYGQLIRRTMDAVTRQRRSY